MDIKNRDKNLSYLQEFIGLEIHMSKFIHQTPTQKLAEQILKEGFEFENHLMHTTDQISGFDLVELNYFLMIRRNYGQFTIVIVIADELINYLIQITKSTNIHYSEILSKTLPIRKSDDTPLYTLPEQFIKGYFNQITLERIHNPKFDPYYRPPTIIENFEILTKDL
ncbi:MAG: hypothetical protein J7K53_12705 [Bacteroidales bacterium]|nr:hypothetical protein [Bacteroidales bacterium]